MKKLLLLLLSVFLFTADSKNLLAFPDCKHVENSDFEIRDFFIKDFTMRTFIVQTRAKDSETLFNHITIKEPNPSAREDANTTDDEKYGSTKIDMTLYINDVPLDPIKRSINKVKEGVSKNLSWEVKPAKEIDFQEACITMKNSAGVVIDRFPYTIPNSMKEPGQQPLVLNIQPRGGTIGDTITMLVQNPGKDLNQIVINIIKPLEEQEGYAYLDKEKCNLFPYYLSEEKTENNTSFHELKFTLSNYLAKECGFNMKDYTFFEKMFGRDIKIKLTVNARPSTIETITLLEPSWKKYSITLGALITLLFMGILAYFSNKINFFPDIFIDPVINTYSLANFQSFAWTIVLMGSYFYIAVCQGLILGNPQLPEFNFSLIALLGVSYGGMIASNYVDKRKEKFIVRKEKPELRDLIFDPNGGIDMARMQLFGFNLICLLLYVYYLLKSNPLNGLPSIPETLHSLLGTSQAGYIGSQAVAQMVSAPKEQADKKEEKQETKPES